ncbi:MAG: glutamine-synthetase adenylyltransferase [Roseobacter sp.]
MNFGQPIARVPRPFDPQKGLDLVGDLPFSGQERELLIGTAGSSPYLAGLIVKEAEWLANAQEDFAQASDDEIAALDKLEASQLSDGLRTAKRRVALVTALGDLAGAWPLEQVTQTLTRLADMACQVALRQAVFHQIQRGKLPGMTEEDVADAAGMVVLAMGKMGAEELNYSSDIDLICLFDETRFDPADYHDARSGFARATRAMTASLSEITAQGYVFRTDLRLRPDPSVTPVCIAMEAAEHYYESLGRTWERAAYIKARVAAGDGVAGAQFLKTLQPFVWRRHLDFAAIQDAHDMRLAIRAHKSLGGPITLPGHDMKLGRGGIREIEFFTQTRQLIAGGRDPDLRCRGTVAGLEVLAEKGWIDGDAASTLSDHYRAHRTVEHRLQMIQDAQTHALPKTPEGFDRLAALMDRDVADLQADLHARLAAVHETTEGFFAPGKVSDDTPLPVVDEDMLNRWMSYPALRSARSRELFERVKPELLSRLAGTERPDEALLALDGFLSGLPAGVQLFSLLEANPQLTDLIIDISGTSPALAQYLSRNAGVFDAVIGGDFFAAWPGQKTLEATLKEALARENDYERHLDATRLWFKERHFQIGVHLLRGLVNPVEARAQYSDLAGAVLHVLWPIVADQFSLKYGAPPGRGAVVLGMGSLGARTLTANSDLDLIVIYDPLDQELSSGEKEIPSRLYYARLTQALITALSAPMAQGKLFEVDMRLRPSGNQGPVATSWQSFQSYQKEEAWVWEHLALTRARVVAGPDALAKDVDAFIRQVTSAKRGVADVASEVAQMRMRIQQAKAAQGLYETKIGAGRLQEIELLAQAGALLSDVPEKSTLAGLEAAVSVGMISGKDGKALKAAASCYYDVHTVMRLLSPQPLTQDTLGLSARQFLLRTLDQPDMGTLDRVLQEHYARCDAILTRVFAGYTSGGEPE